VEEDKKNELDLSDDDLSNIQTVMSDLIDVVAKFNGLDEITEADYAHLKMVLDFSNFVVSGVIYSNGLDLTASHEHIVRGDDDDDDEGVE
jgi:hypothetical protein